ncbi:hypothetical protein BGX34_011664 [Mortierella sp. NVP85]|nr:hypothetical protein BGX34_011664 [Mortierella sp. NVP85]
MGLFNKPLLPARYDNEDVQVSAELCPNIHINVIGLAKGEITILSGNEDMIQITTSVQAKESILRNAAALEPVQDGNRYTYTIHTPLEDKLEKAVTFQVFITIPRLLDSLESFIIEGSNIELSIGNISHTFIRNLSISNSKGDISIDNFYGESATIVSTNGGSIKGSYSVARLMAQTKTGKITSNVRLLNTDDHIPSPKVLCSTLNSRIDLRVDGTDLFGPFTVEAKTQCAPLEAKILVANKTQKLLGNLINFGGPIQLRLSTQFQGRLETRTHYGKIHLDEPTFVKLEGAVLSIPSLSDRNASSLNLSPHHQQPLSPTIAKSMSSSVSYHSLVSPRTPTQETGMPWGSEDMPAQRPPHSRYNSYHQQQQPSPPGSIHDSGSDKPESISEGRSPTTPSRSDKQKKKDEDKESTVTRELIGTFGDGPGLIMAKNSSGDITVELI